MKEKLKQMLTHNLTLKILSVILAVFTWLIMVNVSNPMMTVTQTVPVEFTNADVLTEAGLTYEPVGRNSVTVSYKIHVRDEARVTASDFAAYADLAQLYDVTGAIPVQAEPSSYMARLLVVSGSVSVSPAVVRIQTEPIQTKTFALGVRTVGDEAEEYDLGGIELTPARISVTGAESVIGQISSLGVEIDVEGIDTDITGEAPVCFYDANGNLLDLGDKVQLSEQQVSYRVTVLRVEDLTLDFIVSGTVAPGYRFTGVESDVRSISVVGPRASLADMTSLTISGDILDIDGAAGDMVVEVDLNAFLPDNISLVADQPSVVTVTMHVERLETRQYEFRLDRVEFLGRNPDYEYTFAEQALILQIRGLSEDLDTIDAGSIRITADLTGLEPGEHQIVLNAELKDGFDYIGPTALRVSIADVSAGTDSTDADGNPSHESDGADRTGENSRQSDGAGGAGESSRHADSADGSGESSRQADGADGAGESSRQAGGADGNGEISRQADSADAAAETEAGGETESQSD